VDLGAERPVVMNPANDKRFDATVASGLTRHFSAYDANLSAIDCDRAIHPTAWTPSVRPRSDSGLSYLSRN